MIGGSRRRVVAWSNYSNRHHCRLKSSINTTHDFMLHYMPRAIASSLVIPYDVRPSTISRLYSELEILAVKVSTARRECNLLFLDTEIGNCLLWGGKAIASIISAFGKVQVWHSAIGGSELRTRRTRIVQITVIVLIQGYCMQSHSKTSTLQILLNSCWQIFIDSFDLILSTSVALRFSTQTPSKSHNIEIQQSRWCVR